MVYTFINHIIKGMIMKKGVTDFRVDEVQPQNPAPTPAEMQERFKNIFKKKHSTVENTEKETETSKPPSPK